MASIIKRPGGHRWIQFVDPQGKRKTLRIGMTTAKSAAEICRRVELLLAARVANTSLDRESAGWLAGVDGKLRDRLVSVGLIEQATASVCDQQTNGMALGEWLASYVAKRTDTSPHTRRIWRQTVAKLNEFFGEDRSLESITRGEAKDWRLSLVASGLADASVRKHCGFAKHFFSQAVDHEIITQNPFGKLVSAPVGNEERQYFVSREETQRVLDACPDAEWRLIVALSRYGGLRCPSEHFALKWEDVSWSENRLHVTSPKTSRHEGHKSRVVPLFPDLRPFLEEVWEATEPGTECVISRHRMAAGNLRTQFARIIKRAGLTPWPRITHNLRSSRQTELEEVFPSHVVCRWIGNSPQVARKHYLQVTEDHFQRAVSNPKHFPKQQAPATSGTTEQDALTPSPETLVLQDLAKHFREMQKSETEVHGNRTHLPRVCRTAQRF